MKTIVFFGRGGQGAKTAAHILAESAFNEGKEVQAFPEYGPERSGAPMRTYVKISDNKITDYSPPRVGDYLVVIDSSLLLLPEFKKQISSLMSPNTILLVNSIAEYPNSISVDVSSISQKYIGSDFANIGMLAPLIKASKLVSKASILKSIRSSLKNKDELIAKNIKVFETVYRVSK